ncbi:MAG: signal peptidase II [Rhodobacterales bacterium]|nr:MAG: signal peptidase II [Rhodobacterales bacterium]
MRLIFWAGFWVFLADQASKYLVVHWLDLRQRGEIDVLPPLVNFRMAWNQGVNFGLFSGSHDLMRWVLIAVSLGICAWVYLWIRRGKHGRLAYLSAGLLIGGALGNVLDRLLYGAVADFLNMSCCGIENPYSFNIADIGVFAGALGLIFFASDSKTR